MSETVKMNALDLFKAFKKGGKNVIIYVVGEFSR